SLLDFLQAKGAIVVSVPLLDESLCVEAFRLSLSGTCDRANSPEGEDAETKSQEKHGTSMDQTPGKRHGLGGSHYAPWGCRSGWVSGTKSGGFLRGHWR